MGCYNSVVVNASAENVWSVLSNFHDLSWAKNVISKVDIVGDKSAKEVGAKRILNNAFHETLRALDEKSKTLTYSIDDGPAAVSKDNVEEYIGKIKVYQITDNNTSFVEWSSSWKSAKDDNVATFCNPIYYAILQDLKNHFS